MRIRCNGLGSWAGRSQQVRLQRARTFATVRSRVPISPLEPNTSLDYTGRLKKLQRVTESIGRPLCLSEKILYSHLDESMDVNRIERGRTILRLHPDRAACHDATATMALLQFISANLPQVAVPTTIHSDHLVVARDGADADIERALVDHREVYEFLSSASRKYGIGYWKAGSGIIHIVLFENYAFPGGLMIGTDSHTPNAGGLGMLGIGVGGSDAVDAMAGMHWELMCPKIAGVRLTGSLATSRWTSSKDIICKLAGILGVAGGKGKIIEFFGPGVNTIGATAMATVCNMSAEIGSTSCIFPYTEAMGRYLRATNRQDIAEEADAFSQPLLTADAGSDNYYDEIIDIDLDTLEPHINGPFTPDLSHPLSKFGDAVNQAGWPSKISSSMVGSCTNSSYEDLLKVQNLVRQAKKAGVPKVQVPFLVSPGSEQIRATAAAEGIFDELQDAGATILSSSCGPCVGQWHRTDVPKGEKNSVISSYNRNFAGRHDGNPETHSFVTSPEMATIFAYAGDLSFNPVTNAIPVANNPGGLAFQPPSVNELPPSFLRGDVRFQAPAAANEEAAVDIDPLSDRLQLLPPFPRWTPDNGTSLPVLLKVSGKCTTDHISPAGPWYKYRGHIENISNNLLLGARNAFLSESSDHNNNTTTDHQIGHSRDPETHEILPTPVAARRLKDRGTPWAIVADTNYGEGSSREHAALSPRYLGCTAVVARSFARIHETNLKKQGVLPLTFEDPADYERVCEGDRISVCGAGPEDGFRDGESVVMMRVQRLDGGTWEARLNHTYQGEQARWLWEGSALNCLKSRGQSKG